MNSHEPQIVRPPQHTGYLVEDDSGLEFRELLRRLWAYKWLIAAVIALGVGGTWVYAQQLVPRYTATAVLMIDPPRKNIIDFQEVVEGIDTHPQTIRSEVVVLESRELAAKAVDKLNLAGERRFNAPRQKDPSFDHVNPLTYVPQDWKTWIGEFWRDAKASVSGIDDGAELMERQTQAGDAEEALREAIINRFLSGRTIVRDEYTKIVRVLYTAEAPRLAAEAANALADVYVENTLEVKYAGTREATEWLRGQLDELRQRVAESEAAVERIRQGEALIQGRDTQIASEQISEINRQLLQARTETARVEIRLKQIEELRLLSDWVERSATLLGSEMMRRLRLEQLELQRQEADFAAELGPKYPKLVNVRVDIVENQKELEKEFERILQATHNELAIAQAHEQSLQGELNAMTTNVGKANDAVVELRAAEREAEANRTLYDALLARAKETDVQQEVLQADARVISYAQIPTTPSFPPTRRYMTTAVIVSLGLALGLVFLIERLDNGYRTSRQVTRETGLSVLAMLPWVNLRREKVGSFGDLMIKKAFTRATEATNVLYSNLKWPRNGGQTKIILVTSAMPREGKTSTAIAVARRAALLGDKVLLVDADFRQPEATKRLGLHHSPGLGEILARDANLEETLQRDGPSGADVLSCGFNEQSPVALIGADSFRMLLARLKSEYDLIVVDSPPVLAVADAQILARIADQTLVVIHWGKTPRKVVVSAVNQLRELGANLSGVALTHVDVSKQSYYGYGEYGYYTEQMKDYYSS